MEMARWVLVLSIASLASVLIPADRAAAATIYGLLLEGGQPVANTQVVLVCGTAQARTTTDAKGTYRLTLPQPARCRLDVRNVSASVILYADPTRYDFEIVHAPGPPRMIRK